MSLSNWLNNGVGFTVNTDQRCAGIAAEPTVQDGQLSGTTLAAIMAFDFPGTTWPGAFLSASIVSSTEVGRPNIAQDNTNLSHANTALTAAQSAYDAASSADQAADAAVNAAYAAFLLQTGLAPLEMEVKKATINLATITRRSQAAPPTATAADVSAAQARLDAANAALGGYVNPALAGYEAAIAAADPADSAFLTAQQNLQDAQTAAAVAQTTLSIDTLNAAGFDAATAGGASGTYTFYTPQGNFGLNGFALDIYPGQVAADPSAIYYTISAYQNQYRHSIPLSAEQYASLIAEGVTLAVHWCEVSSSLAARTAEMPAYNGGSGGLNYAAFSYLTTAGVEPVTTFVAMTESFDARDATQQLDGSWIIYGQTHTIAAPDPGSCTNPTTPVVNVTVQGAPTLPSQTATVQFQGTERWRQGWSEYQTTAGQVANRYLTCTADTGPGAPAGTTYGGTLALLPGDPGVAGPDNVWAEDPTGLPPGYPLYVRDTLSASCGSGRQYPWSTVPDTDGATLLSATQRILTTPPGLRLTLSDPQTTAAILADAQSVRDAAWPADPPAVPPPGYVAPVLQYLAFEGAINLTTADGDHVIAQKMRFKLHYSANDTRVLTTLGFQRSASVGLPAHRSAHRRGHAGAAFAHHRVSHRSANHGPDEWRGHDHLRLLHGRRGLDRDHGGRERVGRARHAAGGERQPDDLRRRQLGGGGSHGAHTPAGRLTRPGRVDATRPGHRHGLPFDSARQPRSRRSFEHGPRQRVAGGAVLRRQRVDAPGGGHPGVFRAESHRVAQNLRLVVAPSVATRGRKRRAFLRHAAKQHAGNGGGHARPIRRTRSPKSRACRCLASSIIFCPAAASRISRSSSTWP